MKCVLIFVLFVVAVAYGFTEKKNEKTGIIFAKIGEARVSYDCYSLLYHFDISNYLDMTGKVNKCMGGLNRLCRWIKPSNCELLLQNLQHHFNFMKSDEVYRINQRTKRGLFNFGGKIMHWLNGLMDEDMTIEYAQKINDFGNITKREHKLQQSVPFRTLMKMVHK